MPKPNREQAGAGRQSLPILLDRAVRDALLRFLPAGDGEFLRKRGSRFVGDSVAPSYGGVTDGTVTYTCTVDGEKLYLLEGAGIDIFINAGSGVVQLQIEDGAGNPATAAGLSLVTAANSAAQTALLDVFTAAAKGLVPLSGGGTTKFLRADATWAVPSTATEDTSALRAIDLGGI